MKIQIDQSGKVEYTATHTVVASSTGTSVYLSAVNKRRLQKYFRDSGLPAKYTINVFATLVAYVIKYDFSINNSYTIDIEYPGRFEDIRNIVFKALRHWNHAYRTDQFSYRRIGKRSEAHRYAYTGWKQKKTTRAITYYELMKVLASRSKK